jgi:hypothetical protein
LCGLSVPFQAVCLVRCRNWSNQIRKLVAGLSCELAATKMQVHARATGLYLHGFDDCGFGFGHWNSAGHDFAAEAIAEWLLSL